MKVLFVDAVCNKPYDLNVLNTEPLGGTEATVVRIAEGLASQGVTVRVTQHCRTERSRQGAEYTPFKDNDDFKPTHIVVLRAPLMLRTAAKQYPNAKLYLWLHDLFDTKGWSEGAQAIVDTQAIPILVSDFHKTGFHQMLQAIGFQGSIPSRRIYNPIEDDLRPDETQVDKDKLVFFSSPHKGLKHTLSVFDNFKNFDDLKNMKLCVANPGYFPDYDMKGLRNVENLGPLPHSAVLQHVRSALAVFHLNPDYPETFGLVHAECNAVGTPFLSSRIGATQEIADHPSEMIDVRDNKAVIERIRFWRNVDRPRVRGRAMIRLPKIIREWKEVFEK